MLAVCAVSEMQSITPCTPVVDNASHSCFSHVCPCPPPTVTTPTPTPTPTPVPDPDPDRSSVTFLAPSLDTSTFTLPPIPPLLPALILPVLLQSDKFPDELGNFDDGTVLLL